VYADSQYRAESLQRAVFDLAPFRLCVVSREEGSEGDTSRPSRQGFSR
jgi:hypothetical protein